MPWHQGITRKSAAFNCLTHCKFYLQCVMIARRAEKLLKSLAKDFKVITITGPRQSGKTTLARKLFKEYRYVSLENPDMRLFAIDDPRGFLKEYSGNVILDEIQKTPELLSYLQQIVDEKKQNGSFVLTGSQSLLLSDKVSQTLAGRTAGLTLLPFQIAELIKSKLLPLSTDLLLFKGLYPPVYDTNAEPEIWYNNYTNTYLERDVRDIIQLKKYHVFSRFLRLLAGRIGQPLNMSSLADDTGVSHNTIREWVSVLEASYIIYLLKPYYKNFNKRLIKASKVYFVDTGIVCNLLNIENSSQVQTHPLKGAIFENLVVIELLKERLNQGKRDNLFFFRDRSGFEVDVIRESGTELTAIEIKSASTVATDRVKNLYRFKETAKDIEVKLQVIYDGDSYSNISGIQYTNVLDAT